MTWPDVLRIVAQGLDLWAWASVFLGSFIVLGVGLTLERQKDCWIAVGLWALVFVRSLVWFVS